MNAPAGGPPSSAKPTTESLRHRDQHVLVHSLHSQSLQEQAHVWAGGRGAVLVDHDGREFLDALAGLWNVIIGHGREELAQAAQRQMSSLAYASGYTGSTSLPAIELGERLQQICYPAGEGCSPGWPGMGGFYFATGGGEAVDAAVKTARWWWKLHDRPEKTGVIGRRYGYHGTGMVAMSATGLPAYWPMFEPRLAGVEIAESPYPYRFDRQQHARGHDDPRSNGEIAADLIEETIEHIGADRIACVLAEPVQGAGGVIVPPDDYWPRLRAICSRHDVLLIADEIITGFGRTGPWFALERWGVEPDLVCFAKGIPSGYVPLAGVGFRQEIAEAIRSAEGRTTWMHAATYSGHPVACAVANANLAIIEREGLREQAAERGSTLLKQLATLSTLSHVGEVRGLGLMAAVELVANKETREEFPATEKIGPRVHAATQARGMFSRLRGDVYNLAPCYPVETPQLERMVEILGESIHEVTGA